MSRTARAFEASRNTVHLIRAPLSCNHSADEEGKRMETLSTCAVSVPLHELNRVADQAAECNASRVRGQRLIWSQLAKSGSPFHLRRHPPRPVRNGVG